MKKVASAFTLIELIVWITLSLILMTSVSLFVSSGMQNILTQQKVIEESSDFIDNTSHFQNIIQLLDPDYRATVTASWIIFKINKEFSKWGFVYLWEQTLSWSYCQSDSDSPDTSHVFLKTFIPFEEEWENIFSNFTQTLTWSLTIWIDTFTSDQKNHIVSKNWVPIIWKGIFWDQFIDWVSGTGIYLNSPTWLAHDGNNLYIADTLNNRVLYLDSSNNIHILLNETDGLAEPTGLLYLNNSLYISNSKKWEILEYDSKTSSQILNLDFTIDKNISDLISVRLEFLSGAINISEPNNISDFSFTWINQNPWGDYLSGSTNVLEYFYSDFSDNYDTQLNQICSWTGPYYKMDWSELIRETFDSCSGTGTLRKWKNSNIQNILSGDSVWIITASNTTWAWLSNTGSYYIHTTISWTIDSYDRYDNLFTLWDNNLTTKNDNYLSIFTWWLSYPTWIWDDWWIKFNESWTGTFSNLPYSENNDTLLLSPLESLTIDTTNNLLSILIKYYRVFNCYNSDDRNIRSWILKKNLQ